ncbi:metallo-beta-lactamase domain-containing protein [Mollisia scopiformis]|uniref:Metallo-beta-lactamase domain-containing protein n=1 Tax=Mollisia scopiformis TaxID=149040 RepID=A0A194X3W5_MOLSC|nr:metallo-beta-lactamase domain-containing protein [Mollisia scopiformis]KUJ14739.1 metallo-beta-lactamase domain-containing protein [Mollisia scopiformis]
MATQIIHLPEVDRLSARIIRILGGNPGKVRTNTYIVGTGQKRLLIDTGEGKPSWIANLKDVLTKENIIISKAIITHWHHDHQGGIKHLLECYPGTDIFKNQPDAGQQDIQDGQIFQVDGASLRAVFSPGHTQDHMSFVLEEEDAMFTGDNVLGAGTAVFEDLATYLNSLEIMRGKFQGRAYPGHGPVIEEGPAKILEYILHRKQREEQVVQILKSKSSNTAESQNSEPDEWASMDIVKIIYKDVPENLHVPAHGGVMQVLRKLETEEKVVQHPKSEKWRIKDRAAL